MFQQWIKNLNIGTAEETQPDQYWFERVTAMLLLEIARSDTQIDPVELKAIEQAIKDACPSIPPEELEEIVNTARQDVEKSISLHEQIRQINTGFNREQKISLIEHMWRIAYADGDLDKYEEYTIRQLCDLIYVDHKEYIQAKLRIVEGKA